MFQSAVLPLGLALAAVSAAYTWPATTDFLEATYYQQIGYDTRGFGLVVARCNFGDNLPGLGRTNTAEWLRLAYHDMATADVSAGTGGLDASIAFELGREENRGDAFRAAFQEFKPFLSVRTPMADLIALGTVMSFTSCTVRAEGAPLYIPLRGGRVDATGPGPSGVPEPQQDLAMHTEKFARQGFNATEMIMLVGCGHTLGGVHGKDFPEIVPVVDDAANTDSIQAFDDTQTRFDNHIATMFLQNSTQNALAFGLNETTRSDHRIFTSDGGETIRKLAGDNEEFLRTCSSLFERMINTVPKEVKLSEPIQPIPVKPDNLDISFDASGNLVVYGEIRVSTNAVSSNKVFIHIRPPTGSSTTAYPPVQATYFDSGRALFAYSPNFNWYKFSASIPAKDGLSGFVVEVQDASGKSTLYDNGGGGFPLNTQVIPQKGLSCSDNKAGKLNVTAVVLDDAEFSAVTLSVPIPHSNGFAVPKWEIVSVPMNKIGAVAGTGYSLYRGVYDGQWTEFVGGVLSYDVRVTGPSGDVEAPFNLWRRLGKC